MTSVIKSEQIRKANTTDANAIAELYRQLLPFDKVDDGQVEEFLFRTESDRFYNIFVIECDGNVVATCTLIIIQNITHGGRPFAILENVVTDDKFRHSGFGKALVLYAIEYAKRMECHKISVMTRRKEQYVKDFYRKCDFSDELCKGFLIDFEGKYNEGR